ncbi:hypothetical protein T01_13502 [Trichinella spiralis]|uniref:Uncharacterized protein n=1 Tax=Trichinella spiralis TaxID=6334 RepID=A0A0V1BN55_TRISP|nr:hypothetical protein T01_13502 [Trichinella spiralis]
MENLVQMGFLFLEVEVDQMVNGLHLLQKRRTLDCFGVVLSEPGMALGGILVIVLLCVGGLILDLFVVLVGFGGGGTY